MDEHRENPKKNLTSQALFGELFFLVKHPPPPTHKDVTYGEAKKRAYVRIYMNSFR